MVIHDISNMEDMGFVHISRTLHKPKLSNQIVKPYISNRDNIQTMSNMNISQFGQYVGYVGLKGLKVFLDIMVSPRTLFKNINSDKIVKGES